MIRQQSTSDLRQDSSSQGNDVIINKEYLQQLKNGLLELRKTVEQERAHKLKLM